jgi:hypothetical protein
MLPENRAYWQQRNDLGRPFPSIYISGSLLIKKISSFVVTFALQLRNTVASSCLPTVYD